MTTLHSNAALRVLRREMARLNDARGDLIATMDQLPIGVAVQQIQQCDSETAELTEAHHIIEGALAAQRMAAE